MLDEVLIKKKKKKKMAIGLTTLFSATSILGFTLIPLVAIGLTIYKYNQEDPESHPFDREQV